MKNAKGIAYALASSSTFGLIPLFTLPVLQSGALDEPSLLFYRFALASLAVGAICAAMRKDFRVPRPMIRRIVFLGVFYAATSMGLTLSYRYVPSGVATTIHFLYPVLVAGIMVFRYHEKSSRTLIAAAGLSLAGIAALSWGEDQAVRIEGLLLVGMTVATYAVYIVGVNKSGVERIDPLVLTFYVFVVSTALFAVFCAANAGIRPVTDTRTLLCLSLLALLPTVISDFTLILAVKYVGSTVTAILGSMEPLVAVLVGIFCFGEPFGIKSVAGLALVITAVTMVVVRQSKR